MPQPKDLESYPPEFLEIAIRLQEKPAEILRIPCPTEADATRLRFRLYGFQAAMKKDKALAGDFGVLLHSEIRVIAQPPGLEIQSRDYGKDAMILRAALDASKG